ncbi:MAG: hypothetical protein JJ974_10405 [Phycisphaerales bacterium]|nr:hypothetical protein [Phycisphaerales bacterium]
MMTSPDQSDSVVPAAPVGARAARSGGWVIAAIAMHLLVASMASAATTCSETMERTRVTRLSHCVAQVIRELVDQTEDAQRLPVLVRAEEPRSRQLVLDADGVRPVERLGSWLLDLPPPMMG